MAWREQDNLDLAAFSPHLTAPTYTRVSGTSWRQPCLQHPQAQGREEGEPSLTDPTSQSLALIPALPALCFATRTWAPTSPQSLASRPCQGESSLRKGGSMRHYAYPHPRPPACLTGSPLPCLCHSLRTWLGAVTLSCHGTRPTLGTLKQPVWGTNCSPSSWAYSLLFITHASASPST